MILGIKISIKFGYNQSVKMGNTNSSSAREEKSTITTERKINWSRVAAVGVELVAVGVAIAAALAASNESQSNKKQPARSSKYPTDYVYDDKQSVYEKDIDHDEYMKVSKSFFNGLKAGKYRITGITKIENHSIKKLFDEKYNQLKSLYNKTKVVTLFHGTKLHKIKSICKINFDLKRAKADGIFFAVYSQCAMNHTDKEAEVKTVILADVLVGRCEKGPENKKPPFPYDTRISKSEHVYVKYEAHTFIPRYVIYIKECY